MNESSKRSPRYAAAGVDIELGNRAKRNINALIRGTHGPCVLGKTGGFGGLFDGRFLGMRQPVLVSSIDGVGTKLKVASLMERHETVGADLVNHCINDIAVLGAQPLFFLDYFGMGRLEPRVFHQVLRGLAKACKAGGCALIGGETAQMPGIYQGNDYDLAGAIVGVVDRERMIDGSQIRPGDALVGFASSGLHTNGYSLARSLLFEQLGMRVQDPVPGSRKSLGDSLLAVHVNYRPVLTRLAKRVTLKGLAHITGGGFFDNIPRMLPKGLGAEIELGTWPIPPIFRLFESAGVQTDELYHVLNMGVGMVAALSKADAEKAIRLEKAWIVGRVARGAGVRLVPKRSPLPKTAKSAKRSPAT
jgi:phosphoribosylformylglycinamidine cyclo-ligase